MQERTGAIVVGAGGGRRMGGVEKAFLSVDGRPLIAHSVAVFQALAEVHEICLVVSEQSVERARRLVHELGWNKVISVVAGGAERQDSVRAGLNALHACEWVLVHDAARPLVTPELIRRGLEEAQRCGAAVAATPVRDTLKRGSWPARLPEILETVDRSRLWAVQTPQVFRVHIIRDAFKAVGARAAALTDDAAVVQAAGGRVFMYEGDPRNIKVTVPDDVALVEALLAWRRQHPQ
jgi:2-C-methyl-D-erythritol 4-phosphate cytidylyltransferase